MIPNTLSIAGVDPSGGAGILADVKTMMALGAYGCAVVAALTAQNTQAVTDILPVAPEFVGRQIDTLFADVRIDAVKILRTLRLAGVSADIDHAARSLKAQFKYADRLGAPIVLVVGGDELARGTVKLRDMRESAEAEIPLDHILEAVREKLSKEGTGV